MLNGEQLRHICPSLSISKSNIIADRITFCSESYKFNTVDSLQEFVAELAAETGEFSIMVENMNYTKPSLLMANWPKHFPTVEFANQYIRNPEKLARYIYGSTSIAKTLGNKSPEDGWNFRGSGYMQLTGRDSATKYQIYVGLPNPEYAMELLRTDDYWATDAACWEFAVNKKLIPLSLVNTPEAFVTISKRINGGTIGMEKRKLYYERCKLYIK